MSSNQTLKDELFSNLKDQGFADEIKKQLRAKIIEKLKDKHIF
jgi:hypothetical protein